jgi:biotin carboxyl carrier protein
MGSPDDASREVDLEAVDGPASAGTDTVVLGRIDRPDAGRWPATVEVVVGGWRFELEVEDSGHAELRRRATRDRGEGGAATTAEVHAIIPGRVMAVEVAVGDRVVAGQGLLVVEAMKMQNELRSPRAGVVTRLAVEPGRTIELGDLLAVIAEEPTG